MTDRQCNLPIVMITLVAIIICFAVAMAIGALVRDSIVEQQSVVVAEPMPLSAQCSVHMNCLECHPMHGKVY